MTAAELFWVKVLFAAVVAAIGLTGTLLPGVLREQASSERALAISDTFAGGVLGGAGLLHLLPNGIDNFHVVFPRLGYPLGLLLAGVGFLLILLIEGVIATDRPAPEGNPRSPAVQHEPGGHVDSRHQAPSPVILLMVLSVHSVILGLALGAQTALAGTVVVFLAVVAHKAAAGFALGVGYERAGFVHRHAIPQLAFFSAMTPLGIVVGAGVGVALTGDASVLFEAIFDSLGAGTFVYIAALDIIKTEFDQPGYAGQKWLAAAVGFGLMAALAIWV